MKEDDYTPVKRTQKVGNSVVEEWEINGHTAVFVNNQQVFGKTFETVLMELKE